MTIQRKEKLRVVQAVYAKWSAIYGERDDTEAEDVYFTMFEKAMAEAEARYRDESTSS